MRICICSTMVPFSFGGAEILVESLRQELTNRGFATELVTLPFAWSEGLELARGGLAWRLIDLKTAQLEAIDLVIATRFPSYMIRHPNKVVWLIHQFRQAYDLDGTSFGCFSSSAADRRVVKMIHDMDNRGIGEAQKVYAIAGNVAHRLKRYNDIDSEVLYPPPKFAGSYRNGDFGGYIFAVGRLDRLKRFDLLVRAMAHTAESVRCLIAGSGSEEAALKAKIAKLGLAHRVKLLGWVDDQELLELYANCSAVYYGPLDEDYGYVTVEAFRSGKPVITTSDSGGVLEFVSDGVNGYVCSASSPRQIGHRLDELAGDPELARRLGASGSERVGQITWDRVIGELTGTAWGGS